MKIYFNTLFLIVGIGTIILIVMGIIQLDLYHTNFFLFCVSLFANGFLSLGCGSLFYETIQEYKKINK